MKRASLGQALGLALLGLAAGPASAEVPADAGAWLVKMSQAFHTLNYDAAFIYVHDGRIESMRVLHAVDQGRERERLTHLNGPVREILRDGETVTCILPEGEDGSLPEAERRRAAVAGLFQVDVERLSRYYDFELKGETRVAGRAGQHILVSSKDGYRYGYRLVLDQATGLLLRSDLTDERGQVIEQVQVVNLSLRERIAEAELTPDREALPMREAGPELEATTAAQWRVGWLPEGFNLTRRKQQPTTGSPTEYLMYNDGLTSVSVYIQAGEGTKAGTEVLRRGGTTVYDLPREGFRVTVIGDVPLVTAQKIADSVRQTGAPETRG